MSDTGDQTETMLGAQPDSRDPPVRPTPMPDAVEPRMLGRRYLLEERIASGGMASVWRAHDEVLARTVAVKCLHDHLAEDAAFRERFRREAVTAARLAHANIVSLYDTGTDGDQVYLVMEFIDGATLRDVIADVGTLEIGQVASIGMRVARALDYAHSRGLVHRDVKPANILIGEDGTVKVADFGIAKADRDSDLTRTGMVLGTAAYVAPEQVLAQPLTGQADQYALGCVLYEALSGRRPFKGESPVATAAQRLERDAVPLRSLRADIPRGLEQIVTRCMAREPANRFLTCNQVAEALSAYADPEDEDTISLLTVGAERTTALPLTPPPSSPAPAPPPRRSADESFLRSEGRWLAPVLALLALAGALVGVGLATGVLEAGPNSLLPRFAEDVTAAEPQSEQLEIAELADFDPLGDGAENGDALENLTDGDPETAWRTEGYDTPGLGGLKEGVGFTVDLGQSQRITGVELTTTTPGIAYDVRVSDTLSPTITSWRIATFDEPEQARYLLVWITGDLQRDGRFHYAGFSDIEVQGAPA